MSHVKKYRLATIELILVITLTMMGGGFAMRETRAETKGLTIGYKDNILFSEATKLTASGDNVIFGLLSASSTAGSFLKFQHIKPNGAYEDIFVIDHAGNITTTGQVLGSNNYWKLNGSSTNLYASSTAWNVGIGTTSPVTKLSVQDSSAAPTTPIVTVKGGRSQSLTLYDDTFQSNNGAFYFNYYGNDTYFGTNAPIVFKAAGSVGIGTTSPATKLHIYDASSGPILTMSGLDTNYRGLTIKNSTNTEQWFAGNNASNNFVIRRSGTTDYLTIASNGNLGVGITNPAAKLDITNTIGIKALNISASGSYGAVDSTYGIYVLNDRGGSSNGPTRYGGYFEAKGYSSSNNTEYGLVGIGNKTGGYGVSGTGVLGVGRHTYASYSTTGADLIGVHGQVDFADDSVVLANSGYGASLYTSANIPANKTLATYYGLYMAAPTGSGTITNRYGIYQANSTAKNYFASNVGIGTTTPAGPLHVYNASSGSILENLGNDDTVLTIRRSDVVDRNISFMPAGYSDVGSGASEIYQKITFSGGTVALLDALGSNRFIFKTNGVNRMSITSNGNVSIGTTTPRVSLDFATTTVTDRINVSGGYVAGLASVPVRADHAVPLGYLQANYNSTSTSFWESSLAGMINNKNTGNVGVGITNPSSKLEVATSSFGQLSLYRLGSGTNWGSLLEFALQNASSSRKVYADLYGGILANTTGVEKGFIAFRTIHDGTIAERLRISSNGNVGIATTNPGQKLEVVGNMILTTPSGNTRGFLMTSAGGDYNKFLYQGTGGSGSTAGDNVIFEDNRAAMTNGHTFFKIKRTGAMTTGNIFAVSYNGSSNDLVVYNNGFVGIGSSNPSSRLTLAGGDFELDHNKSIKVSSTTGNTTLLLGNYADESGFSYGTSSTLRSASLAVEGDVKADRLCFENDCKFSWSEVVSSGGGSQWATSSSDIYNANSGNVGIGKSNPVTSKLQILASGSGLTHEKTAGGYFYSSGFNSDNPYLTYYSSTGLTIGYGTNTGGAPTVNTMTLFNNGYVAIGTTATQTAKFYVSGGSISDGNGTGATLSANGLFMDNDELSTTAGTLFIGNSSNNFKHINLGASLYVKANGTIGIGTTTPIARLAITSSGTGTGRAFSVSDSNNIEKVTILDNGSVGIGITTSTSTLAVKGAGGLRITNGGYDANLIFGATDAWKSGIRVADNGDAEMRIWHANANGQIVLATGYNGDGSVVMPTDGLFIDQNKVGIGYVSPAASTGKLVVNGNVGIGTTNPASKLVVSGGGIYVSGVTSNSLDAGGGQVGGLANTPTEKTQAISWGFATSTFFMQGGNSFGATSVLGTNDNNHLNIKTNNSVRMTIANGGNIGIGTTNPANQLSITKSGGLSIFDVTSYNSAANNRSILFFRTAQGTEASPANVAAADMIGEFIGSGYAGGVFRNVAGMNFQIDPAAGSITSGNLPSLIYFETTSIGSTTRIERMRITSSGNVGIGTTNPGAKLQVAGDLLLSGTGKLTANTIDPPYFIDGRKYATYMAGMTGVKEETTGVVKLRLAADKSYYYHVLDIGRAEEGSDLWLFGRTANLKQNGLNAVTVLLAPSFSGRIWYEKDSAKQLITIKASGLKVQNNLEVSYRLSAPRFDTAEYGNRRPDSDPHEGINLDKLLK